MSERLLTYFKGDDLAASAWKGKYAIEGEVTPDDMHRRLAKEFGRIELKYKESDEISDKKGKLSEYGKRREFLSEERIYELFKDFKYIVPQGSVMSQLGAPSIGSLSNCFVIGQPEDSYGGIFKKDEEMAQLMKRRGGVGLDISTLRPETAPTSNAAKSSTGAVSFMHRFSNTTREVAQNGRRGALMISIDVNHPDVLEFAKIKRDLSKVTGANISIRFNNDFMKAVEMDNNYVLRFPIDAKVNPREYDEYYPGWDNGELNYIPKDDVYVKVISAKEVWDEVIKSAHNVAEPGLFFINNHWDYSPDGAYSQYRGVTTNPCGEIFMQPYDACRLIAINLFSFVKEAFTDKAEFDFEKFYEVTYEAMRLSDDLVDLELEHIERILEKIERDPETEEVKARERALWLKIQETAKSSRRTGLGFTALGDMLAALGLKYDSNESLGMVDSVMHKKLEAELDCTIDLAVLKGTFTGHDINKEYVIEEDKLTGSNEFYSFLVDKYPKQVNRMLKHGRRNVSFSTVAPTGTVSLLTQTTSGLEPIFMPFYMRRKKVNPNDENVRVDFTDSNGDTWQEFPVLHPKFKEWLNINLTQDVEEDHVVESLSQEELQLHFEKSPWYGATANDIDWIKRVELQGIIQKYTTHSISSTINLPNDVKEFEVSEIYMESWKRGLKGITVYRDGSRSGVLVNNNDKKEETTTFHENHAPKRLKSLDAKLVRFNNNKEKWIAFVGLMDNKPYEIFTGKLDDIKIPMKIESGHIVKTKNSEGIKSYNFEYEDGVVEDIGKVFHNDFWNYSKLVSGALRHGMPLHYVVDMVSNLNFPEDHINTWKNGVARALKKFIPDGEVNGLKCEDCGGRVRLEEGCMKCIDCGSSKCS